jgi:hypothetical protein
MAGIVFSRQQVIVGYTISASRSFRVAVRPALKIRAVELMPVAGRAQYGPPLMQIGAHRGMVVKGQYAGFAHTARPHAIGVPGYGALPLYWGAYSALGAQFA